MRIRTPYSVSYCNSAVLPDLFCYKYGYSGHKTEARAPMQPMQSMQSRPSTLKVDLSICQRWQLRTLPQSSLTIYGGLWSPVQPWKKVSDSCYYWYYW